MEKLSYSKLSCYQNCGWQYKLTYIDKHFIYEPAIATEFGTLVHSTEETIARKIQAHEPINYEELQQNFMKKSYELSKKFPQQFYELDKSDRTYEDKVNMYVNESIFRLETFMKNNPDLEIVGIEQSFKVEHGDYVFHGFIDRVFKNKITNELIIEDIKTYSKPVSDSELVTPLQFVFYVLGSEKLYNIDESKIQCAYDLPLCNIKQTAGTKGFVKRGEKKIDKLLAKIEEKDFHPNPTPLCHWCIFSKTYPNQPDSAKFLCPYYLLWTKNNHSFDVDFKWEGIENHERILESFKLREGIKINKRQRFTYRR